MQEIIIFIKPKNLRFQILTIFQLVSAFLASTVQLKFLFFLLAYLQKIPTCKLKIHFVVYRFESHTIHSMWRILSKRETVFVWHTVLQYFLCPFQYVFLGLIYFTVFKLSLWTKSLIFSGAFQSKSWYFEI